MAEENSAEEKRNGLEEFSAKTLQSPWRKPYGEAQVCQHIAAASFSHNTSIVVFHACAAAEMYVEASNEKRVESLNVDLLKRVKQVDQALAKPHVIKWVEWVNSQVYVKKKLLRIAWGFAPSESNFKNYIEPWFVASTLDYAPDYVTQQKEKRSKVKCSFCGAVLFDEASDKLAGRQPLETVKQQYGETRTRTWTEKQDCDRVSQQYKEWIAKGGNSLVVVKTLMDGFNTEVMGFKIPYPTRLIEKSETYKVVVCPLCRKDLDPEKLKVVEELEFIQDHRFFFQACRVLTEDGYLQLCHSFRNYAESLAHRSLAVLSSLVDHNTLAEAMKLFKKKPVRFEEGEEIGFESVVDAKRGEPKL